MILERADQLSAAQQDEVRTLATTIAAKAGAPPLNDESLLRLGERAPGLVHLSLRADGELVGYAQLDNGVAELAVRREDGPQLLDAVEAAAGGELAVWTHGVRSPIMLLLDSRGYRRTRLLHQLRLPLTDAPDEPPLPDGVEVRTLRVGADEDAWLGTNAAAFAEHPEQGGWTRADLTAREAEPWFDPAGFFLAWQGETLVGFHWTKVHPDGAGEVYVLGVDPSAQGMHLGGALLDIGLRHLAERGCPYVLLYVDDSNTGALRLYERAGFTRHDLDAQWTKQPAGPSR
jgi:mycothiol synthase